MECSICNDDGIELHIIDGDPWTTDCKCLPGKRKRAMFKQLIERSNMELLSSNTFENFKPQSFKQKDIYETIKSTHDSYYLFGSYGVGKSHLMYASAFAAMDRSIPSVLFSVPALLSEIRKNQDKSLDIEKLCYEIDYLILDDIGKEKPTEWVQERLFIMIDKRWNLFQAGKGHTSFTSQYAPEMLINNLDKAIISRIKGMCKVYGVNGEDMRGKI